MKASPKEIQCIDISREYRNKTLARVLKECREERIKSNPLFIRPSRFQFTLGIYQELFKHDTPIWRKTLVFISLSIAYIFLAPLAFLVGVDVRISGNSKRQVKEFNSMYFLDDEVSAIKSFSQLWDDKGLRDYGVSHMHFMPYREEVQKECIIKWVAILYGESEWVTGMLEELEDKIHVARMKNYKENPNIRINFASAASALPEEIDKKYGLY